MRNILAVSLAVLIGGLFTAEASARLSSGEEKVRLQTIQSWTAHLNQMFPGLDLAVSADLSDNSSSETAIQELELLEDVLHGARALPTDSLVVLACSNPVCGDSGGGKCKTCVIQPNEHDDNP